jgi:hypothetical protein
MTAAQLADLNGYVAAIVHERIERGDIRPRSTITDETLQQLGLPAIDHALARARLWLASPPSRVLP